MFPWPQSQQMRNVYLITFFLSVYLCLSNSFSQNIPIWLQTLERKQNKKEGDTEKDIRENIFPLPLPALFHSSACQFACFCMRAQIHLWSALACDLTKGQIQITSRAYSHRNALTLCCPQQTNKMWCTMTCSDIHKIIPYTTVGTDFRRDQYYFPLHKDKLGHFAPHIFDIQNNY